MNIITSNCLGGFIYRDILNQEYQNPFIWTAIKFESFINLLNNYDSINFNDIELKTDTNRCDGRYSIVIANSIELEFPHVHFSAPDITPRYVRANWGDVFYNKPWKYIVEKYNSRLKRMNGRPIIVTYNREWTQNKIDLLVETCTKKKYKTLVCTHHTVNENMYVRKVNFVTYNETWNVDLLAKHAHTIKEAILDE